MRLGDVEDGWVMLGEAWLSLVEVGLSCHVEWEKGGGFVTQLKITKSRSVFPAI
jgi:hypothetical protein